MSEEAQVVFLPSGRRGRFAPGISLLKAARTLGVDVNSVCGGRGICGRCQISVAEGDFPKLGLVSRADALTPSGDTEAAYAKRKSLLPGRRLSCSARLCGDVVVDVPPESQLHRQLVRKAAEAISIELDPVVRLCYVEVAEPDLHAPSSDLRRLRDALARDWGLTDLDCDGSLLPMLQKTLRQGGWKATVAIYDSRTMIAIWPGLQERALGLAADVGSTTIAAHLCDLLSGDVLASVGMMNPQIRFGEDLMSRVSYVMMNPGGERELTHAVRQAINGLAAEAAARAKAGAADILAVTFVGNPVMHHLLLGLDPTELGGAPFALATDMATRLPARELGLDLHPGAQAYVLPCIAGHVGADTAGVILAERPDLSDEIVALVDVGTNAEIVLGNRFQLLACSSPTGPAFEGAQISAGQRAAPGAIERVRIDPVTLEPRFKVIGSEFWSDAPEFDAAVTGICGSGIIEAVAELFLAGAIDADGRIDGTMAARSQRVRADGPVFAYVLRDGDPGIWITQNDVRAIQLAKAALQAGVRLLMDRLGVDKLARIRLAGAFGSHIDVKYAAVLGMLPDCAISQMSSAGNAAGTGARIALLSAKARGEIEDLVRRIEKIETAVEPNFQAHFVAAMAIPHASAPYPELAKVVTLPERKSANRDSGARRSRRRAQQ